MKIYKALLTIFLLIFSAGSFANTVNIAVGPGGTNTFSPATVSAVVGDTIKWTWITGVHNVTSNSVPGGASSFASQTTGTAGFTFTYVITVAGTYTYECTLHFGMNGTINATASGIAQENNLVPDKFDLKQNFPNPFNPETKIRFSIPEHSKVKLSVLNLIGQEVGILVNEDLQPGNYVADFNAAKLNSGVYFYKIEAKDFTFTRKMLLVK